MTKIKTQFPKIKYNAIHRRLFNKLNGLDMLSKLCIPSLNGIVLVLQHRYLFEFSFNINYYVNAP